MIRLFFYILIILFLNSCGGFSEAGKVLRNEKTKTTDEFLVKKREPLSQPPDMDKIPEPGSVKSKQNENNVNKILKVPKEINNRSNSSSSLEKSILDEIKK